MNIPFIDLKSQYLALQSDIDARIKKVLDHGQYIMGPEVKECEDALAQFVGCKYAITCSNGSDALMMAMMAVGLKPGDEVITSSFSFIATAEMIAILGLKPVFIDIEPDTYNMDPDKIVEAITPNTKAIMPVSLYGQPADMDAIQAIAKKYNLFLIEDGAQSFGGTYKGKRTGNISEIGCTSFFPAKPLGCYGDGGAVFTSNDQLAEILKSIRVHGMGEHRYHHPRIGINGRLDSIQCAVLLAKLTRYDWEIEQREHVASRYQSAFGELANFGVKIPVIREHCKSVWAQYTLYVPDRESFQKHMQTQGVPTAVHYPITMADQPAYSEISKTHNIPNARLAAQHVVSLPMFPDMKNEVQDKIIQVVRDFYTKGSL